MNPALGDLLAEAVIVLDVAAVVGLAVFLLVFVGLCVAWVIWAAKRTPPPCGVPIEKMPGHPERVRPLADPIDNHLFGDIAEQLLDDGLAEVCEITGWME